MCRDEKKKKQKPQSSPLQKKTKNKKLPLFLNAFSKGSTFKLFFSNKGNKNVWDQYCHIT